MRNYRYAPRKKSYGTKLIVGLVLVAVVAMLAAYPVAYRLSAQERQITVESKERVQYSDSSKYLVFTDTGVFEVTDSLVFFDWSASDRYASLNQGASYTVTTAGWRIPLLSKYPNIIEIEKVE